MFKKLFKSLSGNNRRRMEDESPLGALLNTPRMQNRISYQIAFDHLPKEFYHDVATFITRITTKEFDYGTWQQVKLRDSRTAHAVTFKQHDNETKLSLGQKEVSPSRAIYAAAILSEAGNLPDEYFVLVKGPERNYIRSVNRDLSSANTSFSNDSRFDAMDALSSIESYDAFLDKISFWEATPEEATPEEAAPEEAAPEEAAPEEAAPEDVSAKISSESLVLANQDGVTLTVRIKTSLGKNTVSRFGEDAQFWSEPQCTLDKTEADWHVTHDSNAQNETMLNGKAITGPEVVKDGDELSAGRESKGIIKLPLKVQIRK